MRLALGLQGAAASYTAIRSAQVGQILHQFQIIFGHALALLYYKIESEVTNRLALQELFHLIFAFLPGIGHKTYRGKISDPCWRSMASSAVRSS